MNVSLLALYGDFNKAAGGGIQRYIYELHRNLRAISGSAFRVTKKEYAPAFTTMGTTIAFSFESLMDSFADVDIIHNLLELPFGKPRILRGKSILVGTAHEFASLLQPQLEIDLYEEIKSGLLSFPMIKMAASSILDSDYLIANSSQTREEAIQLGYNRRKAFVVNLGVDSRFSSARRARKPAKGQFVIGTIGTIRKRKGMDLLINASKMLDGRKYRFDIYGNSAIFKYEEFLNFARRKNIVNFKGFADERHIVDVYDGFDAFVYPSRYEGFGLPIMEAKARGLPVILYKYGRIPKEVRRHCFEAEDSEHIAQIVEKLRDNGYNEKKRKKAMEDARSFTWKKTARKTLEVYRKIAS